jgi:hypothetical protein
VHQTLDEENRPVAEYIRYNLTTDDRLRVSLTRIVNSAVAKQDSFVCQIVCRGHIRTAELSIERYMRKLSFKLKSALPRRAHGPVAKRTASRSLGLVTEREGAAA